MLYRRIVSVVASATVTNISSASSASVAPDTVIFIESDGYVPVIFESQSANVSLEVMGLFDTLPSHRPISTVITPWEEPTMSAATLNAMPNFLADSILIGDQVRLPVNIRVPAPVVRSRIPRVGIPATSDSDFMRAVGSYVLMNGEGQRTQLVLNPNDPGAYALDNEYTYVQTTGSVFNANIEILSGQVVNRPMTPPLTAEISLGFEETYVPHEVMTSLYLEFRQTGNFVSSGYPFLSMNDDRVESLPRVSLNLDSGVVVLYPSDYLKRINEVRPGGSVYKVMLSGHFYDKVLLGRHVIVKFVIHVDPANNRVGFGEPIDENI